MMEYNLIYTINICKSMEITSYHITSSTYCIMSYLITISFVNFDTFGRCSYEEMFRMVIHWIIAFNIRLF